MTERFMRAPDKNQIELTQDETDWLWEHLTRFPGFAAEPPLVSLLDALEPFRSDPLPRGRWVWVQDDQVVVTP